MIQIRKLGITEKQNYFGGSPPVKPKKAAPPPIVQKVPLSMNRKQRRANIKRLMEKGYSNAQAVAITYKEMGKGR